MITGSVRIDATAVAQDQLRRRVAAVETAPDGALVILIVGNLLVDWPALCLLREQVDRLHFDVQGEVVAVERWVRALRTGEIAESLGLTA